jgi:HD-GYP domain-containing protein (c-di-GMP phosphodiesterase class II)
MTKYIDLLREHENKKGDKKKRAKKKQKEASDLSNPYRKNEQEKDTEMLEAIDELIEENETDIMGEDDLLNESIPDSLAMLEEDDVPEAETAASEDENAESLVSLITAKEEQQTDTLLSPWLAATLQMTSSIFDQVKEEAPADIQELRNHIESFFEGSQDIHTQLNKLESEIADQTRWCSELNDDTEDVVQKSVHMMLYAFKIGYHLKYEQDQRISLAVTSMLHHAHLALLPHDIRLKREWGKNEHNQLDEAGERTLAYLQKSGLNDEEIQAISQVKERYNGTGPKGLEGSEIVLGARFIALITAFEAMTHDRPYRRTLLPRKAIRVLVNEHKKDFDPTIFKALIEAISLYPVGTIVQINTGEIGRVIKIHTKLPLRPSVLINMDSQAKPIDERHIDLAKQSNLMIKDSFFENDLKSIAAG